VKTLTANQTPATGCLLVLAARCAPVSIAPIRPSRAERGSMNWNLSGGLIGLGASR